MGHAVYTSAQFQALRDHLSKRENTESARRMLLPTGKLALLCSEAGADKYYYKVSGADIIDYWVLSVGHCEVGRCNVSHFGAGSV